MLLYNQQGHLNLQRLTQVATLTQVFTGDGWSAVMAQASGCDSFQFQCKTSGQALVAALFFCRCVSE
mgnify:CR=1 FL=1